MPPELQTSVRLQLHVNTLAAGLQSSRASSILYLCVARSGANPARDHLYKHNEVGRRTKSWIAGRSWGAGMSTPQHLHTCSASPDLLRQPPPPPAPTTRLRSSKPPHHHPHTL